MKKLFFHNKFDKDSINELLNLPNDYIVIDVFSGDVIPDGYNVSKLPYKVDKELIFETVEPIYVPDPVTVEKRDENGNIYTETVPGTIELTWKCVDANGEIVFDNESVFHISINGIVKSQVPTDGIFSVGVQCGEPMTLDIEVLNELNGYTIWKKVVEVVDNSGQV